MNIGTVCNRRMIAVDEDSTLTQAASLMREHHVGALIVASRSPTGRCATGVVTDRDLVVDVLARGTDPARLKVSDVANHKIVSVAEDADIAEVMEVMQAHGVRRSLVMDRDNRVVGIVSLDDLTAVCAKQVAGLAAVIRSGLEREVKEVTHEPVQQPMPLRFPVRGTAGWGGVPSSRPASAENPP